MFTILFSSLVSLSLGSLLGLLGAALRWRLLARRAHQPRDVDLILGMPNPTGALKLIAHDCGPNGRWSVTTLVVLAYLLVNIIGRLAVATFGLTYDLNENAGVDYPVMLNDFGSRDWMQLDTSDLNLGKCCHGERGELYPQERTELTRKRENRAGEQLCLDGLDGGPYAVQPVGSLDLQYEKHQRARPRPQR
jgi:hypothetical protein